MKGRQNRRLGNGPLMILFINQLIAMTAFFGRMDLIVAFMSLPSLMTVVGIVITKNYTVKIGKKKMAAIGYIGQGISLILIYVVGNTMGYDNIMLLLILHACYGFFGFSFPIPLAMFHALLLASIYRFYNTYDLILVTAE